jgi:hypothetical protein
MDDELIGGLKISDVATLGPMVYKSSNKNSLNFFPPIYTFLFGASRILKRLKEKEGADISVADYHDLYLDTLNNLNAELLLYFKNRLKCMITKDKIEQDMDSMRGIVKAYKNLANCNLEEISGKPALALLSELTIIRGKKHHENERYLVDYAILSNEVNNVSKLSRLVEDLISMITKLENEIDKNNKIYEIKITRKDRNIEVEWTSINHAFDLIDKKIVKKIPTKGYDERNISYFSIILELGAST